MKKIKNEDSVKIQKRLLKVFGLWPSKSPNFVSRLKTALSFFIAYLNIILLFYSLCTTRDVNRFLRNLNFFLAFFTDMLKITIFYFNWSKFVELLDFLKSPIFYCYHEDLGKHLTRAIKTSTVIMKTFQFIVFPTIMVIWSVPLFNKSFGRELCFDYGMTKIVEESMILYLILYTFQGFALIVAAFSDLGVDGLPTGLMALAAAYFKVLQGKIIHVTIPFAEETYEELSDDDYGKFDDGINEKLKECIDLHLGIIRFAETVEEMFTYSFLLQFLASAVSICVAGFMFIITSPNSLEFLMALGMLGTLLFQISIYCIFGNDVIQQSLKVQDACYMTEWTFCEPKVRKTLFIIMERSKRPSVLTAGKFVSLSLSSLVSILRTAFSYGTVLKQLYSK